MIDSRDSLFNFVYGEDEPIQQGNRAILAPKNEVVDSVNNAMLDRMSATLREYHSTDILRPTES